MAKTSTIILHTKNEIDFIKMLIDEIANQLKKKGNPL
jgi:hypothetical protein